MIILPWFWWFLKWWFITLGSALAIYFALRTIKRGIWRAAAGVGATLWIGSFAVGFMRGEYPYGIAAIGVLIVIGVTALSLRKPGLASE